MAEFDEKLNQLLSNPDAMAQVMQMAQSLFGGANTGDAQPPAGSGAPPPQPPPPVGTPPGPDLFSALGSLDPKLIARLLPLVQELGSGQNSNARSLLFAMRPYLKPERQEKVERALQLAKLFHIGRKFLAGWGA